MPVAEGAFFAGATPKQSSVDGVVAFTEDILRTADELGYEVISISGSSVKLAPISMPGSKTLPVLTLDGYLLSGAVLRRVLAPLR